MDCFDRDFLKIIGDDIADEKEKPELLNEGMIQISSKPINQKENDSELDAYIKEAFGVEDEYDELPEEDFDFDKLSDEENELASDEYEPELEDEEELLTEKSTNIDDTFKIHIVSSTMSGDLVDFDGTDFPRKKYFEYSLKDRDNEKYKKLYFNTEKDALNYAIKEMGYSQKDELYSEKWFREEDNNIITYQKTLFRNKNLNVPSKKEWYLFKNNKILLYDVLFEVVLEKVLDKNLSNLNESNIYNKTIKTKFVAESFNANPFLPESDKKLLVFWGYEPKDFPQIELAMQKATFEDEDAKLLSAKEAEKYLGHKEFLSGLARCAFHGSAVRYPDNDYAKPSVYFDFDLANA